MKSIKIETQIFSRYILISAFALACDAISYAALLMLNISTVLAAAVAYMIGLAVHYSFSRHYLFRSAANTAAHALYLTQFIITGIAGLGITSAVVSYSTHGFHLHPAAAKGLATIASFMATYFMRRALLFKKQPQSWKHIGSSPTD